MLYQDLKNTVERERLTCTKHSQLGKQQQLGKITMFNKAYFKGYCIVVG